VPAKIRRQEPLGRLDRVNLPNAPVSVVRSKCTRIAPAGPDAKHQPHNGSNCSPLERAGYSRTVFKLPQPTNRLT